MNHLQINESEVNALLQIYTAATGIPAHFFQNGQLCSPKESRLNYPEYCKTICKHLQGCERCDKDHARIGALMADGFYICHAGVYVFTKTVRIENKAIGTVLCGHFRFEDIQKQLVAREYYDSTLDELRLEIDDRFELEEAYRQLPQGTERIAESMMLFEQFFAVQSRVAVLRSAIAELQDERTQINRGVENISHEFQIRIQALYADGELLLRMLKGEAQIGVESIETSQELLKGLKRLNVLVQNLSMGLGEYSISEVDLTKIITESVDLYKSEATRKFVEFKVGIEVPSLIEASKNHMTHLLHNLISNAVKYSYKGRSSSPRYILISGSRKYAYYEVMVQNYGIGILPDEIDQIFTKGYRGHMTLDERRTGAGLGLAISKDIVIHHKGKIHVSSDKKSGAYLTTFRVLLPYSWYVKRGNQ
jgi:signal transduction histidine kinase